MKDDKKLHYSDRRKEIKEMLQASGRTSINPEALAEKYGVTERTIYNDFNAIKKELQDVDAGDVYFTSKMLLEMCKQKLKKLKESEHENIQLGAVKQLVTLMDKEFEWAERMGVIRKPAERIEISDEYNDKLIEIYEQLKDEDEDKE